MDKELISSNPLKYGNYKYIKAHWPDEYDAVQKLEGKNFSEKLYIYLYGKNNTCVVCGAPTKFISIGNGYARCCCHACACKDPARLEKSRKTSLEKYGVENISQLESVKKRKAGKGGFSTGAACATIREKYGVDNISQLESVKQKKKETLMRHYGDPNYNNHEATSKTKLERYGDANYNNRVVAAKTTEERYGVDNVFKLPSVQAKSVAARIQKNSYAGFGKMFMERAAERYIDVISCESGWFTCRCPHQECSKCSEKQYKISIGAYHGRKKFNVEPCTILHPIGKTTCNTNIENFIKNILIEHGIHFEQHNRTLLQGKELDFYIPSRNLAIECNGIYWHSDHYKTNDYHKSKFEECKNRGIQLLTIWEDWIISKPHIIRSIILDKLEICDHRIYARQCTIRSISKKEADNVLQYHLQGSAQSSVRIGLFWGDVLISVMTFGTSRVFVKGAETSAWELIRYCVLPGYKIVGGASKLLQYFIRQYNPSKIVSFSSNDISTGDLYNTLGFKSVSQSVSYWYIDSHYKRYHRYAFRKSELVKAGYDKNKTESQITREMGLIKIFDSGQTKWELTL